MQLPADVVGVSPLVGGKSCEVLTMRLLFGERCDEIGVLGLLGISPLPVDGESCDVGLWPVFKCLFNVKDLPGSAGELRADEARGDGNDRFDVGLLGDAGDGLCNAIGTLADLGV